MTTPGDCFRTFIQHEMDKKIVASYKKGDCPEVNAFRDTISTCICAKGLHFSAVLVT